MVRTFLRRPSYGIEGIGGPEAFDPLMVATEPPATQLVGHARGAVSVVEVVVDVVHGVDEKMSGAVIQARPLTRTSQEFARVSWHDELSRCSPFASFVYLVVRCMFSEFAPLGRSERSKDLEIVVLRQELAILRRLVFRPNLADLDRVFLAGAAQVLPRRRWSSFLVRPETLLRSHRRSSRGN